MNEQKLKKIEDYVVEHENVSLTTLCEEFGISMSTLRRSIDALCKGGRVQKRYGCVYSTSQHRFIPFHLRANLNTESKQAASRQAAQLICENDVVYLDSGSTTCYILDYIKDVKNVTVITGNIDILIKSLQMDNVSVFGLPGRLNKKNNSLTPTDPREALAQYNISKMFMAASGMSLTNGFSHSDPWERETKLAAMQKTSEIYFVLDDSKFSNTSLISLGPATLAKVICTNRKPEDEVVRFCEENNIQLRYPQDD